MFVRLALIIGRHFVIARDPREIGCNEWNDKLRKILEDQPAFDLAFVTANHKNSLLGGEAYGTRSFAMAWKPLIARGTKVIAIHDVPTIPGALTCLQRNLANPENCQTQLSPSILGKDLLYEAAKITEGVYPIDLTSTLCPNGLCHIAIDGFTVLRDHGHLTATFAEHLAPIIEKELEALGVLSRRG